MPDREPRIRGRGHPLPFSKGRLATTLFLSGFEAERSYELARVVERAVTEHGADELTLEELYGLVERVLGAEEGEGTVARFRAWQFPGIAGRARKESRSCRHSLRS